MDAPFPFQLYKCKGWDDRYAVDGCWAQPEGSASEWREVIAAMKTGECCCAGIRLLVSNDVSGCVLSSPRNQVESEDSVFIPSEHLAGWIQAAENLLEEQCNQNKPSSVTPR